jgi:hypothetical protein
MVEMTNLYKTMIGKLQGKTSLGRSSHGWEDNIRMDLTEIKWEGEKWITSGSEYGPITEFVNKVMNLWVR